MEGRVHSSPLLRLTYIVFLSAVALLLTFKGEGIVFFYHLKNNLVEWIVTSLMVGIPLALNTTLGWRMAIFFPSAFILISVGLNNTHYSDIGGLGFFFLAFYALLIVIVSHFLLPKIEKYEKQRWVFGVLIVLIVLIATSTYSSIQHSIEASRQAEIYNRLRCYGNSMSVDEFENGCDALTDEFFRGYYQEICYTNLEVKKQTGNITREFFCSYCCTPPGSSR